MFLKKKSSRREAVNSKIRKSTENKRGQGEFDFLKKNGRECGGVPGTLILGIYQKSSAKIHGPVANY